ncbi:hypothetical protein UK23_18650 [Lentzea aerocolonigenes]|uniref:Uncharacterized protein n=1 Tax=Lentzea aerocolonigenes TaxID=68170 RepID=A0A0F0GWW2_LENAE|nr:hypothetical protein [Lentzea aerocolonigenes]KJK47939.1 hypothetical protein UK23_18650 [Lentzea aerocolonigenes]
MHIKRKITVLLSTVLALPLLMSAGIAEAAPAKNHCIAVLKSKNAPPVMTCAAKADAPELKAASAALTPLMTWYDNWHYDGSAGQIDWMGAFGTCDHDGYSVELEQVYREWNRRISSFRLHGNCHAGSVFHYANADIQWIDGDVYSVPDYYGPQFNDKIHGFFLNDCWC